MRSPQRFGHFRQLDGLRGISILLVLLGHSLHFSLHLPGPWEALGGVGVMLFFVLSGFLITGLLCREEMDFGCIDVIGFYRNRALRIFPAYYFLLLLTAVMVSIGAVGDMPWYTIPVCMLYVRNIFGRGDALTHTWTLSLEQQFYTIWPLFFRRLGSQALFGWSAISIAVITLWRTVAVVLQFWNWDTGRYYVRPDFRFDSILAGCWIALLLYRKRDPKTILENIAVSPMLQKRIRVFVRIANAAWVFPALIAWTLLAEDRIALRPVFVTVQMTLATLLLLNLVIVRDSVAGNWLSCRWLKVFGRLSYSIYLWQQLFVVVKKPDWGWIRIFPFDVLSACLAGALSFWLIEQPFLKWKARMRRHSLSGNAPVGWI